MAKNIFRTHKKNNPFTMVENSLINNEDLSWGAKGVLIYLLSKPDGWKVYKADIVKHATNGTDSVKSIIKELRKTGYVVLTRILDSKGQVSEWRYDVYDAPVKEPVEGYLTVRLDDADTLACFPESYSNEDTFIQPTIDDTPEVENPPLDESAQEPEYTELPVESSIEIQNPEVENPPLSQAISFVNPEVDSPLVGNPQSGFPPTSNKELINKDSSHIQSIRDCGETDRLEGNAVLIKEYELIVATIKENIEFDTYVSHGSYRRWLEEWVYLVADCLTHAQDTTVINGTPVPTSKVRERMFQLNADHFWQVKCNLNDVDYPIRNMKKYIFSALYNSLTTLDDEIGNERAGNRQAGQTKGHNVRVQGRAPEGNVDRLASVGYKPMPK